jgi:hypothetical protein
MAKKKNKIKNKSGLAAIQEALETKDFQGIAVVVLSTEGEIMIGSEGLDLDTCQSLLSQSAKILLEESGISQTLH